VSGSAPCALRAGARSGTFCAPELADEDGPSLLAAGVGGMPRGRRAAATRPDASVPPVGPLLTSADFLRRQTLVLRVSLADDDAIGRVSAALGRDDLVGMASCDLARCFRDSEEVAGRGERSAGGEAPFRLELQRGGRPAGELTGTLVVERLAMGWPEALQAFERADAERRKRARASSRWMVGAGSSRGWARSEKRRASSETATEQARSVELARAMADGRRKASEWVKRREAMDNA
jgi:hypothetical protein